MNNVIQLKTSITAENTFTGPVKVSKGKFVIAASGLTGTSSTVTAQYCTDDDETVLTGTPSWKDADPQYTTNFIREGSDNAGMWWRLGVKTGDYSSGTIICEILQAG